MTIKPLVQTAAAAQTITVDDESAGQRLDNFLIRVLKGVPKTHIYRIIRSGEVRRNKGRIQADDRIESGDRLRIPPIRLSDPNLGEGGNLHQPVSSPFCLKMMPFSQLENRQVSRCTAAVA